ncbi:MAG: hypothetical protein HOA33_05660, partial [Gammaproteobacteria bacterium]|nr:hypothetical protein [Gammaproteobacteria bacterium]MBT6876084.1 hypothetical protein [Gammaproteobacteria bacterium]
MKSLLVVLFSFFISASFAQQTISTFNDDTGVLRIPNVVYNGDVYDYLDLQQNESGLLDVLEVSTSVSNSLIPADASFVLNRYQFSRHLAASVDNALHTLQATADYWNCAVVCCYKTF